MVGALSVMGSSLVDSHSCPCLCLDALSSSSVSFKGDLGFSKNSSGRKQSRRNGQLELSSSFIDSCDDTREFWGIVSRRQKKKKSTVRGLLIVNELGGQYEESFDDVKRQIVNYFTYKAVRTVLNQLYEMNPTHYRWFYDFLVSNKPGDAKRFIRNLAKERQDLAERVMVTRLHLYGKWVKKCDHAAMYNEISDQNLELMRERLMETVIWPTDDTNTEKIG